MFTGIIEELGTLIEISDSLQTTRIRVQGETVTENTKIGDSIAVNGICLTVIALSGDCFLADVSPETFRHSSLESCKPGSKVNLERAMQVSDRFGGHIVSGHIDGTALIQAKQKEKNSILYTFKAKPEQLKYIAFKSSVAVDGISLTVTGCSTTGFSVSIIPFTLGHTTLDFKEPGDLVNLECDILSKYVEKLLFFQDEKNNVKITKDLLKNTGFLKYFQGR